MPALAKKTLESILSRRLKLKSQQFVLERIGTSLVGSVISDSFKGKSDLQRVRMIRKVIEDELGDSARRVGTILAYTFDEWNIPLEADYQPRVKRAS